MDYYQLSAEQKDLVETPISGRLFIEGPAGTGKTTTAAFRLLNLLDSGISGNSILVLVPQRTLASIYQQVLRSPDLPAGGTVDIVTLGGFARRLIDLFWPMISDQAGFAWPDRSPNFLTLETSQYFMARVVRPLIEKGYFESVTIDRNRLYSQIIDNLNKAAGAGFLHTTIADRLKSAWIGDISQLRIYEEAQESAIRFRQFCFQHNLLDFSLQIELFLKYIWPSAIVRGYLYHRYHHLIYDNLEEDIPVAQDLVRKWLPEFKSAWLITDLDGGFRSFLGADPENGHSLREDCEQKASFIQSWITPPPLVSFESALENAVLQNNTQPEADTSQGIGVFYHHFYPEMIEQVCQQIASLIQTGRAKPGEIVVLAPYMTDSLRFSLINRLSQSGIPAYSHRPSRSLREQPATNCLLTLAKIAHPEWKLPCTLFEVREALIQVIENIDLVRADLLARICFRPSRWEEGFSSFDRIQPEMQERITYTFGGHFEKMRNWLLDYRKDEIPELDIFLSRLFGELLSQPGFGFHSNFEASTVTAQLIESIQKFRWTTGEIIKEEQSPLGREYIQMVMEGVIAAQYLQNWQEVREEAVLVAPAYSFLMANRTARYQLWMDIGSQGWWERLYQPLTHPYVLSRHWPQGHLWTDLEEQITNRESLLRLTKGLIRRCSGQVYLFTSRVNQQGDEPRGNLLLAIQTILRQLPEPPEVFYV